MRVVDFIVCDDIRSEQGGKQSLMGIYNDKVGFTLPPEAPWPILFRMGVYIRLDFEGQWEEGCSFTLDVSLDDAQLLKFDGPLKGKPKGDFLAMSFGVNGLQLPKPGILQLLFEVRNSGGVIIYKCPYPFTLTVERKSGPSDSKS